MHESIIANIQVKIYKNEIMQEKNAKEKVAIVENVVKK